MITTFLHDGELNQVLPDPNVQTLLDEVRKLTGENWQIVKHTLEYRKWFKTTYVDKYSLYIYVGGCGPWQLINFYSSPESFSINTCVDLGTISNYLMGICSGFQHARRNKENVQQV